MEDNTDSPEMYVTNEMLIEVGIGAMQLLSYGDDKEYKVKNALDDITRRLGEMTVRVVKAKSDGSGFRHMTMNLYGFPKLLTFREELMWRLFKTPPRGKVLDTGK